MEHQLYIINLSISRIVRIPSLEFSIIHGIYNPALRMKGRKYYGEQNTSIHGNILIYMQFTIKQ